MLGLSLLLARSAFAVTDLSETTENLGVTLASGVSSSCGTIDTQLQALRAQDKGKVLATLQSLSSCAGYPMSEKALLPALLWLQGQGDEDVAPVAGQILGQLGWPDNYCIHCLRAFASREDNIYKLMGIRALSALAWKDPEALLSLMEISSHAKEPVRSMVRAEGLALESRGCPADLLVDDWNRRAALFLGRFNAVLNSNRKDLRPFADLIVHCDGLDTNLQGWSQAYLNRVPVSIHLSSGTEPTPMPY